jgi:P27 family predicted phage terminase small subunit
MTRPQRAPRHLSEAARTLYGAVTASYVLEPHHLAILTKALEAFDRAEAARVVIERDGILVTTRLGEVKPSPAVAIERDARTAFLAAIKQLGLDLEGPPPPSARRR